MSSFKKAQKSGRRAYKERSQPAARTKYGLLEKKKDYILRARDFQKKKKILKKLREKANFRNPDEFYFGMIKQKTEKGVHILKRNNNLKGDLQKIVASQDLKLVQMLEVIERKKLNKNLERIQMVSASDSFSTGTHIIFVNSKKDVDNYDPEIDTDSVLVKQTFNRIRKDDIYNENNNGNLYQQLNLQRQREYRKLSQQIDRVNVLSRAREELQLQKHLLGKGARKKIGKDKNNNNIFKWKPTRKR